MNDLFVPIIIMSLLFAVTGLGLVALSIRKIPPTIKPEILAICCNKCPECGESHTKMETMKLHRPVDGFNYLAICPTTRNEVMVSFEEPE